jgi:hypothetical protein
MGRVYLGQSPSGRLVAVKLIRTELADHPDFRQRFAQEVNAARRVSGIFTAPVVDADPDGAQPWLVTAYVSGPSLADAVASDGPLPVEAVLTLAAGLAEGLGAVHAAGVVHRDLKPSNVLLASDGPRIIDFGISRAADSTWLTYAGGVMGSPGFMSPEQAEGKEVGPETDIFSLGGVLTFAATGEPPFGSGTATALLYRVVYGSAATGRVPGEVRQLVERCLAKDPAERPTTDELLAELGYAEPDADWLSRPWLAVRPASATELDGGNRDAGWSHDAGPAAATGQRSPASGRADRAPDWTGQAPGRADQAPYSTENGLGQHAQASGRADRAPDWTGQAPDRADQAPYWTGQASGRADRAPDWTDQAPGRADQATGFDRYRDFDTAIQPDEQPGPEPPRRSGRPSWRRAGLIGAAAAAVLAIAVASAEAIAAASHHSTDDRTSDTPPLVTPDQRKQLIDVFGPGAVVEAYIRAVNARDWGAAWRLGGMYLSASYAAMVDGYAETARDTIRSITVIGDHVTVRLRAEETDGTVQVYRMEYVVRDGVIVWGRQHLLADIG